MLDRRSFEKHLANLKPGGRLRVPHDCGPGRTLLISHVDDGVMAHCFRCSDSAFIKDERSLAERIAALAKARAADVEVIRPELPEPRERDVQQWPKAARVWLYKAGLSNDAIERLGFYWHPVTQRVVMPVFEEGELVYWQARSLNPNVPKYINPTVERGTVAPRFGRGGACIVLTEDILSAIKVGMVNEAWSIMGTSLPDKIAVRLVNAARPVIVMLDPDDAGRKGTAKIITQLRLLGLTAGSYFGRADPKLLSLKEIECALTSTSLS